MSTVDEAAPRDLVEEDPELDRHRLRRRVIVLVALVLVVVGVITLVPGLANLRHRFAYAQWQWLVIGCVLKLLSGLCYVAAFRTVFCSRMRWRLSGEISLAELGANAVFPTGGAGGLALGVWALRRIGMPTEQIARRTVAFFLLTSLPNVLGVVIIGLGLATGLFAGRASLALEIVPAVVAAAAIVLTIASGKLAASLRRRLRRTRGPEGRLPRALGVLSGGVRESLLLLRSHDRWLLVGLIGYLGFDVMVLWATFHAFGAIPPLAIIWMGYLIGELGGLIPVPGGIGGVDVGLVGTLVLYHVNVNNATAAVLGYRAIALWVPAVVGALAFVLLRRSLGAGRAPGPQGAEGVASG